MIFPLIGQESGSINPIWWLLPLLCCFLAMRQGDEKPKEMITENETFYTTLNINESFNTIVDKVTRWYEEEKANDAEKKSTLHTLMKFINSRPKEDRFTELNNQPPRLYSLNDVTGKVHFEQTEVEGGGTVIKVTYSPLLKNRIAKLKAELALKIPSNPIGLKCPSCSKPVLYEFNLCPYCGTNLIKE